MESEQSRPFYNPEEGKPYELRVLPSGSEVSYGAEISTKELHYGRPMNESPKSAYLRSDFKRFGLEYPIITFYDLTGMRPEGEVTAMIPNARVSNSNAWSSVTPYAVSRSSGVTEEDVNNLIETWNQWSRDVGSEGFETVSLIPYPWDGDYYDYRTMRSPGAGASVADIRNYYRDDLGETFNSEWGNHQLDGDGYCEVCDAYGLNCIEQGGNSPESIAAVEEAIRNLENSLQSLKEAGVTNMHELKSAIKQAKLKMYSMMNENRCTCDRDYGEADPDCMACLNEWRNQRYGPDVHDVECVCNECVPLGRYSSYAESYEDILPIMSGEPTTQHKKLGAIFAEVQVGRNIFVDIGEGVQDVYRGLIGGRQSMSEKRMAMAIATMTQELSDRAKKVGANAIANLKLDFEIPSQQGKVLNLIATADAIKMRSPPKAVLNNPANPSKVSKGKKLKLEAESSVIWVLQEENRHGTTVSLHNTLQPVQPFLDEFDGNVEDFDESEFGWSGYFGNDWFHISCTQETVKNAESFFAKDETIVDSQETKGITTNTKQYKDYTYDIPKMIATIPEPERNAVDTDDNWHQYIGALKASGVFLAAMALASGYNKYKNRN